MKASDIILQQFRTDKYKRFWYPTRPLFTLGFGFFLAGLGYIGFMPLSVALWLSAAFAFDDLPLTPIMALITAANNLAQGRKKFKSLTMLTLIGIATIVGVLLGFFVFSKSPVVLSLIQAFIADTGCSPFLISLGAITGSMLAHATNVVSPVWGIFLGCFLMSLLPISVPLRFDIVFISAASIAFFISIIGKQILRAYTKFRYGHTNADGYEMDRSLADQIEFEKKQAQKFNVTPDAFRNFVAFCRERIQAIKHKATFLQEIGGARQPMTNAYKDIYHGLMNPRCDTKDVDLVKDLLQKSTEQSITEITRKESEFVMKILKDCTPHWFLRSDLRTRILYHQAQITPGIEEENMIRFESEPGF